MINYKITKLDDCDLCSFVHSPLWYMKEKQNLLTFSKSWFDIYNCFWEVKRAKSKTVKSKFAEQPLLGKAFFQ